MFSEDKTLKETSPLSIFFVKSGSGGNRLLFRYPYDESFYQDPSVGISIDGVTERDRLQLQNIIGESDEALCNIFSVNPNLCGHKLEIKINNVRYICHPMSLLTGSTSNQSLLASQLNNVSSSKIYNRHSNPHRSQATSPENINSNNVYSNNNVKSQQGDITSFNIVFALRSSASYDIVDCFHDLSKRLAIALSSEEKRCSYLSREIKAIMSSLDEREMDSLTDQVNHSKVNKNGSTERARRDSDSQMDESVFATIIDRSGLAKDLKKIFIGLTSHGVIELKINSWVHLSFCLPHKVHRLKLMSHRSMPAIGTSDIKRCLMYLRPYHTMLLLCDSQELLESLPIDASPALIQLIKVAKPDKNFMDLSVDANLTLMQIFCIVSQLIYWAKATIIYPICDSNMYSIHPLASTGLQSELAHDFRERFPNSKSLHHYLSDFSEWTSLSQINRPLYEEKHNLLSIVAWLLQRRVFTQIHKYIFLVVDELALSMNSANNDPDSPSQQVAGFNHSINQSLNSAIQKLGLSPNVAKLILGIPASRNVDDLKLLISLLPYFDGKHHIEDIMFFENLDRSQVLILCDKYRDILLTCHYEDVAVSQMSPFNNIRAR